MKEVFKVKVREIIKRFRHLPCMRLAVSMTLVQNLIPDKVPHHYQAWPQSTESGMAPEHCSCGSTPKDRYLNF